nr:hypothetical protein [Streptomyces sp. B27]
MTSGRGAGERSDLARIKKGWRGLGGDGFVALPPPTRGRYTQSDGHEDAAELFAARGITGRASFAYWHWQYRTTHTEWRHPLVTLTLHRVLIGVADPAQPLWHYAIDPRSHGWWHRAQEVADNPILSAEARAIGMKAAREHCVTRCPDQVRPSLAEGEVNAARAWLEARADRTAAD